MGVLRVERSPTKSSARIRYIYLAEPIDQNQPPKSIKDDESNSADSNRSHGKILSIQKSSSNKFILSNKRQKDKFNHTFHCCCNASLDKRHKSK